MRNHHDLKPTHVFCKYPCICRVKCLWAGLRANGINYLPLIYVYPLHVFISLGHF